ncbi:MAG: nuclear transport factor 2 family protein [Lachnospiraceae bacterium]|nr:nuclear transport factor 2 family protein [Lachnospiraceae bacterium]
MSEQGYLERFQRIEDNINRQSDRIQIKNVLNRYLFCLQNYDTDGIAACYALGEKDVSIELGYGKREGADEIMRFYADRVALARMPGVLFEHGEAAGVIEIAKDNQTARVSMMSPGYKCLPDADSEAWDMGRYYVEMKRTEEGWKIWHLQWVVVLEGDASYGWLAQNRSYMKEYRFPLLDEGFRQGEPLTPSDEDSVVDFYRPDEMNRFYPEPPSAYDTWDGYRIKQETCVE